MADTTRTGIDTYRQGFTSSGPYLARVVNNIDPMRQGTLEVELLRKIGNQEASNQQLFTVRYLSPFYGVTDVELNGSDPNDFNQTQKSYGFWFVPPDTGSLVMVMFVEGDMGQGYWIGCAQDAYMNYMIPGMAASKAAADQTRDSDDTAWKETKPSKELFGTDFLPVGEINRNSIKEGQSTVNPDVDAMKKPVHPMAKVLADQGTISDTVRGTHTSSARRETPSNVFGISTPGPLDKRTNAQKGSVGRADNKVNKFISRLGGHSMVMDDGNDRLLRKFKPDQGPPEYADLEKGETGGLVEFPHDESFRIRTRTGHQILLHNSEDLIYITNASGSAWIELTSQGKIDIYAADSVSIRTESDFNFVADRDINLSAGRTINLHATSRINLNAVDTVNINSEASVFVNADSNLNLKATGKLQMSGDTNVDITTQSLKISSTTTDMLVGGAIHMTATGNIEFKAASTLISSNTNTEMLSGASTKITGGNFHLNSNGDALFTGGTIQLGSIGNITMKSAAQIHLNGPPVTIADPAQQANPAVAANGADTPPKLVLFPLPGIGQLIVKRAPTQEPWDHHENRNPAGFTYDLTDRESAQMPYAKDAPKVEIRSTEDNEKVPSELGGNAGYGGASSQGAAGGGTGNNIRRKINVPAGSAAPTNEILNEAQLARMPQEWVKDTEFLSAVQALCNKMGAKPVEMLAIMMLESGVSPSKPNGRGYYGLIQFGDAICIDMSRYYKTPINTAMLRQMSRVQQMEWVDKLFSYNMKIRKVNPPISISHMYCMVAQPAYTSYPANQLIAGPNGPQKIVWQQNPPWRGPDGNITRESIGNAPRSYIPKVEAILARNNVKL
jgi:hypothetical protein